MLKVVFGSCMYITQHSQCASIYSLCVHVLTPWKRCVCVCMCVCVCVCVCVMVYQQQFEWCVCLLTKPSMLCFFATGSIERLMFTLNL